MSLARPFKAAPMPMMTDYDWASYRQRAGQESANINRTPSVMDPATLTADRAQNREMFYPAASSGGSSPDAPTTGANITQTISKAFEDFYGRPASSADIEAWTARARDGNVTADQLTEFIAMSARDPRNAGILGNGTGMTGQGAFAGGMMGSMGGGNALSGGFGGFGGPGIMGRAL